MDDPVDTVMPIGSAEWVAAVLPGGWTARSVVADTARSCVVRFETSAGARFFKADRILPPPEAVVVSRLGRSQPDHVPRVLALDEERGWSLTEDAGPSGLDAADTDGWCRVVDRFARVQQGTGLSADEWVALGCRDLRGAHLRDALLAVLESLLPSLDAMDARALAGDAEAISLSCERLASDGVLPTLVHQDLVPVNVVLPPEGEPVFLDWSDTVVGHPFFGCDRLLDSCWTDRSRRDAVIDAYVRAFGASLRPSFDAVLSLRVLYECLRWQDEISAVGADSDHGTALRRDQLTGLRLMARRQR